MDNEHQDKLIAEAIELIEKVQLWFPNAEIVAAAQRLEMQLRVGLLISRKAEQKIILEAIAQCAKVQSSASRTSGARLAAGGDGNDSVAEFGQQVKKIIARNKGAKTYQTQVFKCLGDYEKCAGKGAGRAMICLALAVICIAKQLIPFAPKE